jgi:DNA-binding response OmpR family regulator
LAQTVVFLLEDDEPFAQHIADRLRMRGYVVRVFHEPHALFYEVTKEIPTLFIVDWMLPQMLGLDVVKRIRQKIGKSVAIMMLTQMDSEEHIVSALEAGADDFVVKPATGDEFCARVTAVVRRYLPKTEAIEKLVVGPYALVFDIQMITVQENPIDLAPKEFDLAWIFFANVGRLLSKSELLASVWGRHVEASDHTLTQHIYALRKKLALTDHKFRLTSVYGTGYRFEQPYENTGDDPVKRS